MPVRQQAPGDPRLESEAERDDRNLIELLQELRVSGLGVQVLFGFLLSLPFTSRFVRLSEAERALYIAVMILSAMSIALLVGPVAYHRLVFRMHQKEHLVKAANVLALLGLACTSLAISGAVLLITSYALNGPAAIAISVTMLTIFTFLWFVFPLVRRRLNRAKNDVSSLR